LTAWPSASGQALAQLARRLHRRLAPHSVLIIVLGVGLILVATLTAAAGAVYDAVVEVDGVAALDHPALDVAKAARTPQLTTLLQAFTALGGGIGMPILATLVAVGLAVAWRQWTPVVIIAATAAGSLVMTVVGKAVVGRVRPASGHTLNSVAIAGVVAYLLVRRQERTWSRTVTVACAVSFAFAMGLSRIYLGHQWLTDVLVAWALGLGWLTVVITAHRLLLTLRKYDSTTPPGTAIPRSDA
jgi:membrane-associated phospholipid phosphatase